jgi:hypothetical protein
MKKLFTIIAFVTSLTIFAQAPQGFNYQATVRNSSGALLLNQIVLVKFNILQNSTTGTTVYSETQTANSDDLGHISLVVGQGTATTGTFSSINWGNGTYYLGIELNTGAGYVAMGTTQLFSVPYALYAQSSGNGLTIPSGTNVGDVLTWNGTSWVSSSTVLPNVTTTAITTITATSAISGGNVTSQGGSIVTARGVCYSTSPNPTLSNSFTTNSAGTGTFTSNLTGLLSNTTYYVRAYATNSYGTKYGNQINFTTLTAPSVSIGQSFQGGVVGYIYQPGDFGYVAGETHGIIVSPTDLSTGIVWSPISYVGPTLSYSVGAGAANTNLIVGVLGNGSYAARICYDLVQGGYSDWALPTWTELEKIQQNQSGIGGFQPQDYWASNNDGAGTAWSVNFLTAVSGYHPIGDINRVRAVRYF